MKNYIFVFIILALVFVLIWKYPPAGKDPKQVKEAATFDDCVKQGLPVRESYPPVCVTKSGKSFTQNIGNERELVGKIKIKSPRPNQKIPSPLNIKGQARGEWFFEGQFKASLLDDAGKVLGVGIIKANGEWMTENFVPYEGQITYTDPESKGGKLILEKDNPSGDPSKVEQLIVPVKFK